MENGRRILALRRLFKRRDPDVIVSFLTETNVVSLLAGLGLKKPVVVSERTDPQKAAKPAAWRVARRLVYPYAARVVVLSRSAESFFGGFSQPEIVPNPVPVVPSSTQSERLHTIIGVGRLVASKKFDILLRAYAAIRSEHPGWQLRIVGEGPERQSLEAEARRLGISDTVTFTGSVTHPGNEFEEASIFVSCSILEGFPMAVCEAMAAGLPVIVARYGDSITEIVRDGENGLVIPADNAGAVATTLDRLIRNESLRQELARNGQRSMDLYSPDRILERWERLFEALVPQHPVPPRPA